MSVRPPLFLFLSLTLRPLVSSHSSLNLAFFSLWRHKVFPFTLSILGLEVLGLCKRFSERLHSLLPINCAFCSWGENQALEALHWVPCFYKFCHLIEHLTEYFHVEVIDGVQYNCTRSWVKITTLDTSWGVNSPFRTSPTAPLIVLTTFLSRIYNQAIWDRRELTISLESDIGASNPILVPREQDINYTVTKMWNKPNFPLDTLLGGIPTGRAKKEKKKVIKYCSQYWPTYSLERAETMAPVGITWIQHHFTVQSILQMRV